MKSKRKTQADELKKQIDWAEKIPKEEVVMMLLDGKSKTSCGCEVIAEDMCPHNNMGALQLLMLQFTEDELENMKNTT